jgi:hypothetical protein
MCASSSLRRRISSVSEIVCPVNLGVEALSGVCVLVPCSVLLCNSHGVAFTTNVASNPDESSFVDKNIPEPEGEASGDPRRD